MERLLIFLAVLIVVAIGALVLRAASRNRRPSLHMDSEFLDEDTDLIIGPSRRRAGSPIDRSAQILDAVPQPEGEAGGDRPGSRDRTTPESSR